MRTFVLYTLARVGLFAAAYGAIWLVFGREIGWNSATALYTAIVALAVSAVASFVLLRSLRERLAVEVERRAARARAAFEASRSGEDLDG